MTDVEKLIREANEYASRFPDDAYDCQLYARLSTALTEVARERDALRDALLEARAHIDGEIDVVDGDYGEPRPNAAMRLAQNIDEALGEK